MKLEEIKKDIFTVSQFMSPTECQQWIDFSEERGYEAAKINLGKRQVRNTYIRNNERLIFDSEKLERELWQRIQPFVPPEIEYGYASGLNERFRFYKYFPGQRFRMHQDGSFIRHIHEWSSYTFMIYLNEDMEGGDTQFTNCSIKPETGKALIFRHQLAHAGTPVLSGVKYVLRTDVMYKRKKIDI